MAHPDDFTEFVTASSHRLFRVACLLTGGDLATADDLVADALARVYLAWSRVRADDAFAYARRTVVNLRGDEVAGGAGTHASSDARARVHRRREPARFGPTELMVRGPVRKEGPLLCRIP